MYDIGIDLGTSAVKLLLVSDDGHVVSTVSRPYPVSYPHPGWSEQAPEDWWQAVCSGVPELIAGSGIDAAEVAGIGTAGQMHGLVALDADGNVIRPCILWNDGRTAAETEHLNQTVGKDFLLQHTGNIAVAGFTAPKILWMKEHEPELFAKIRKIMLPKDYINYRLTGCFATDYSDAGGTLLLDVEHKCWSPEMLEICGLTEEQMPALHDSFDIIGHLTPEAAAALGLIETVTVIAGAGDNAAAAVGTGCLSEGQCNISLGTSGTVFLPSEGFKHDPTGAVHAFGHAAGGFHLMGCMLSAASCLKWWVEEINGSKDYNGLQDAVPADLLGRNPVLFLPYLMGERAPHNDPAARSAFVGMSMDTGRAEMTLAVLEGVAFGLKDIMESARAMGVSVDSSTLCGGGAASPLWRKVLANVLNIRLEIPAEEQGPGLGGALLSAYARGAWSSLEEAAAACIHIAETVEPDPALAGLYEAKYKRFRKLYPALRALFAETE